jgi:unsaturated chondroitin disaccharide hydrolase
MQNKLTDAQLTAAFDAALVKLDAMIEKHGELFPSSSSKGLKYPTIENRGGWTQCFYTGMLFLAYEYSKNKKNKRNQKISGNCCLVNNKLF